MEDFKKPIYSEAQDSSDSYLEDIERKLKVKRISGIISSKFDQNYSKNLDITEQRKKMAINRAKTILTYWGVFLVILTNSFAIYPVSVKIVRRLFKLTGFWNIHFGIIPIMLNWNAVVLGFGEGVLTYYRLKNL